MCLAVPGKITSIDHSIEDMTMAKVDFGGIIKNICVQWVDVKEGDYILAHAGMAISVVDTIEAEQTLNDLKQLSF
ncbi:HypC/HybG/HupF family hydrogenase formation chaperone [Parabacteroides bouchesdurhonensis]|uniref:HypC/HybG/HupF family hydrogenase formation chaperone n=1 Tax=Parabacteroides bouchesdurhonensis TaxID=1936995 RepID=UPI000C8562B7|nr:HypC/HybG/HupF family hydrogenase formation chaperone [Parabacteroides bouchesdurhonensis]RHJ95171.1 HypC/HybG/HupF family hydrogenase formation chaperone [Bacteroides sp. AM07-16]